MDLDQLVELAKNHAQLDTGADPLLTCAFAAVSRDAQRPVVVGLLGFDDLSVKKKGPVCRELASTLGAHAVALVSEVWGVREMPPAGQLPHECPDRVLFRVVLAVDAQRQRTFAMTVVRASDNTPRFGEWEDVSVEHDGMAIVRGLREGILIAAARRGTDTPPTFH